MAKRGILMWTVEGAFALTGLIAVWAVKGMGWTAWQVAKFIGHHPRSSATLAGSGAFVYGVGWVLSTWALGLVFVASSVWRAAHRSSFDRWVTRWVRTWWRRWAIYRRTWVSTMSSCGLVASGSGEKGGDAVPECRRVTTSPYWDHVTARLRAGHDVKGVREAAEKLRTAWPSERCGVRELEPGLVALDFMRRDPFRHETIRPVPVPRSIDEVDLTALHVGSDEFLNPVTVSLPGGHTVCSGSPGAGKASLQSNLLRQLVPHIAAGLVKPVLIDPKAMELRQVADLAPEGDYVVTPEATKELLQRLVTEMREAGERLGAGGERDHKPTVDNPLRPIFIDELSPLLSYWPRTIVRECDDLLGLIASMGRAVGYILVGNIQEPTKDVFRLRDLFGRRFGLRLPTEAFTDAALADKAVERGALSHEIPESLPGVAYMFTDGARSAVRMRFAHIDNDGLAEAMQVYRELTGATEATEVATVTELDTRRDESEAA